MLWLSLLLFLSLLGNWLLALKLRRAGDSTAFWKCQCRRLQRTKVNGHTRAWSPGRN